MARIFISHSSHDNAAAMAIADWLGEQGWDDVFLDLDAERGIKAGERWQASLKQAAERCELVVFLLSPAWRDSKWCVAEFLLAKQMNKRIAAVIVEPVPLDDLPGELTAEWQLVDLTTGARDHVTTVKPPPGDTSVSVAFSSDGLKRLRIGIAEAGLDARFFAWPPEDDPGRAPYRGLKALEAEDAGIFFGRDGPIVLGLDTLRGLREAAGPRLMAILGASGSGKSSFMRAGLLPRLKREDRQFLPLPPVRPERAAISGEEGLIASLERALGAGNMSVSRAEIRKAVEAGSARVRGLLAPLVESATHDGLRPTLVLPVDQGEELFSNEGAQEADAFLTILRGLIDDESLPVIALFTIRSESFEALQSARVLEGVRRVAFDLPPMPRGAFSEIVLGPARRLAGSARALKIEEPLVDALLADADQGGAKDALPLLAFTLERLYREHGGDGDLKLSEYEELGRVRGSIEAAVAQAMKAADGDNAIPRDDKARYDLLRRGMIPWLAGIDPDTGLPRRRVARFAEIPEDARPLMQLLVAQRLLATDVAKDSGEVTIEPAHEALLRQWNLLQAWLDDDAETLATLEGVRRAARDWAANDRDATWIAHGGNRLEMAQAAAARPDLSAMLGTDERAYLEAARAREDEARAAEVGQLRRERRLYRIITGGSLTAALVMGVLGWQMYGLWKTTVSEKLFWEAMVASANNSADAEALFEQARESGNTRATLMLALQYAEGELFPRDDVKAAELYEIAANAGDATAMYELADFYLEGRGVDKDASAARDWFAKASENGNMEAQTRLAYLYLQGIGGERDVPRALALYEAAAAAGQTGAMNDLGWVYRNGNGVEVDHQRAQAYYEEAANRGNLLAMAHLADGYVNGIGVPVDHGQALEWYARAAEGGNAYAMANLGWMYQQGQGTDVDLHRARELYERASGLGNAAAMNALAGLYQSGLGVAEDQIHARRLFLRSAEAGNIFAMSNYAAMLYDGRGGEKDLEEAARLMRQSADGGNFNAMNSLGWMFERGEGVPQDLGAALDWYRKSAAGGVAHAMTNLGRVHEEGIGVAADGAQAADWYRKAGTAGHPGAWTNLGQLYHNGVGVEVDYAQAREAYLIAAGQGDAPAMYNLGIIYRDGDGVPVDREQARSWFARSAALGDEDAARERDALQQSSSGG